MLDVATLRFEGWNEDGLMFAQDQDSEWWVATPFGWSPISGAPGVLLQAPPLGTQAPQTVQAQLVMIQRVINGLERQIGTWESVKSQIIALRDEAPTENPVG